MDDYRCGQCNTILVACELRHVHCPQCESYYQLEMRCASDDSSDTCSEDSDSTYESQDTSDSSDDNLSDFEEIDETEVLDLITDQERQELADDLLNEIIRLGRGYRTQ